MKYVILFMAAVLAAGGAAKAEAADSTPVTSYSYVYPYDLAPGMSESRFKELYPYAGLVTRDEGGHYSMYRLTPGFPSFLLEYGFAQTAENIRVLFHDDYGLVSVALDLQAVTLDDESHVQQLFDQYVRAFSRVYGGDAKSVVRLNTGGRSVFACLSDTYDELNPYSERYSRFTDCQKRGCVMRALWKLDYRDKGTQMALNLMPERHQGGAIIQWYYHRLPPDMEDMEERVEYARQILRVLEQEEEMCLADNQQGKKDCAPLVCKSGLHSG